MASKNGVLMFEDEIKVTTGKFVTQESLTEYQNIVRTMAKYAAKLKVEKERKEDLESLFVQAHTEGKRSAKGEGKLQLIVTEGPKTNISWKSVAEDLCKKFEMDFAKLEEDLKKEHTKQVPKVKVI